ncbi:MAG: hypothetical protein Kow0059_20250 [Candidatus Sumerlaeia bacterium]
MDELIFLPRPSDFHTLNLLSVLLLLIHLPYAGVVLGSTLVSGLFSILDHFSPNATLRRFARDVMDMGVGNLGVVLMLGVVPPVALMLIYTQFFYGQTFREYNLFGVFTVKGTPLLFFGAMALLAAGGFVKAWMYREFWVWRKRGLFWPHVALGLGAHGLLVLAYFIYTSSTTLFMQPALWLLVRTPIPLAFDWNVVARFGLLSHCFLVVFGLWIVFYRWRWRAAPEGEEFDERYEHFIRYLGGGLALAMLLPLPVFIVWNLGTLPQAAYTVRYFIVAVAAVVLMIVCGASLYRILREASRPAMPTALVSFLIVLFFFILNDQLGRESANRALRNKQNDIYTAIRMEEEAKWEVAVTIDLAVGQETFKNVCSTCHAFDKKVVGPPYRETLPKYENDFKSLMGFISNPHKINPAYPAMPRQPINKKQVVSVAAWIMKEAGLKYPETMEEIESAAAPAAAVTGSAAPAAAGQAESGPAFSTVVYTEQGEMPPGNSLYYTGRWQDVSSLQGARPAPVGPAGARALPRAHAPTGVLEYMSEAAGGAPPQPDTPAPDAGSVEESPAP